MYIRAHVCPLVEATTVLERGGFGAGRVCISWFSRPTTLAPRVASRRLHHTVEHYITENDEPRVQSPGTLASLMCVMPLPRGECTAPATIYIPRNSRNRSHFVALLCALPSFLLPRMHESWQIPWNGGKARDSVFLSIFLETDYENYGICLINGVIEIAELWNYFTNVVPNVTGRKYPYIHGCGCVYEFR